MDRLVTALGVDRVNFAIATQLASALRDQLQRFSKMLHRCQRAFSEEAVHDARVSCRRLIAQLTLVRAAMGDPGVELMLQTLKRLLKSLGDLRDVQVQKSALADGLHRHPEIAGLWIELARREDDLIRAGSERVARFKLGRLERQVRKLCAALEDPVMQLGAKSSLREAAIRALWGAFDEVLRRQRAIVASRPNTVHRVRVAYKKFRYMVDSMPPALGCVSAEQLSGMAAQQRAMGEIQDVAVGLRMLDAHRREHPLTSAGLERLAD